MHFADAGELDGVADEVDEDLSEFAFVAVDAERGFGGEFEAEGEALLGAEGAEGGLDAGCELAEVEIGGVMFHAAGLDFGEVEDFIDETEDVLAVYTQLQIIQSEIEVLKGQIKYYDESVALSAVSIRLIAEETVQPVEIGGWKLEGTANDAIQDLIYFTQGFIQFLIRFVLYTLPALVLVAIPLYLLFLGGRKLYRRFAKAKAAVEVKEEVKK